MIAAGMWVQAVGIAITALFGFLRGLLWADIIGSRNRNGLPDLLAAIGDGAPFLESVRSWRVSTVARFRIRSWSPGSWHTADLFGINAAIWLVGLIASFRSCGCFYECRRRLT